MFFKNQFQPSNLWFGLQIALHVRDIDLKNSLTVVHNHILTTKYADKITIFAQK